MTGIVKKIIGSILTIAVVACLVFIAFAVIPGDPAVAKLGTQATPERLAALRETMGLNKSVPARFVEWIAGVVRGDFGSSYSYSMPVTKLISDKLPVTVILTLYSFVLMIVVSVPLAIVAARHENSAIDRVIQILSQVTMSVPPFFGGIIITLIFGLWLHLFAPGGYVSYTIDPVRFLTYMLWPALAIALPKGAMAFSLLYGGLTTERRKDYARTAYSRGNSTKDVFYKHLLKNACIPVITFFGMALADMIAGSIVIEQVFGIPGLGRILLISIQNRDYPVVEAIIVCIAVLVIVSNLLVDILYGVIDPRIVSGDE